MDQDNQHQVAITLWTNLIQIKLIRIKFTLLQCERNNSVNTNLIRINLMQIKSICINLVHSVNATDVDQLDPDWLLVCTKFDPDRLDPNQIEPDPDEVSCVNSAS